MRTWTRAGTRGDWPSWVGYTWDAGYPVALGHQELVQYDTSMGELTIVIEKHSDGYVSYPIGLNGVVVGEGDTFDEVLADVNSAIHVHIETFGREFLEEQSPLLDSFLTDSEVSAG